MFTVKNKIKNSHKQKEKIYITYIIVWTQANIVKIFICSSRHILCIANVYELYLWNRGPTIYIIF